MLSGFLTSLFVPRKEMPLKMQYRPTLRAWTFEVTLDHGYVWHITKCGISGRKRV